MSAQDKKRLPQIGFEVTAEEKEEIKAAARKKAGDLGLKTLGVGPYLLLLAKEAMDKNVVNIKMDRQFRVDAEKYAKQSKCTVQEAMTSALRDAIVMRGD